MKAKFVFSLLLAQISCASLTASSTDSLRVNASAPGATVHVNGINRGLAPMVVDVPRKGGTFVEVSAPGYRSAACSTQMSASGGYIAADVALCLLLFPIGCLSFIDAGGAWNGLNTDQCDVVLAPEPK